MSHYIILTAAPSVNVEECTYRVRADRIDWMADRNRHTTVVSVNGTELFVEEPCHIILNYIKNPDAPIQNEDSYERDPCILDYKKRYGNEEGHRRYCKYMHIPMRQPQM